MTHNPARKGNPPSPRTASAGSEQLESYPIRSLHTTGETVHLFCTPLGWVAIHATDSAVCRVLFGYKQRRQCLDQLGLATGSSLDRPPAWIQSLATELREYFRGVRCDFSWVPICWPSDLRPFALRVYEALRQVPFGRVITYGQLARSAGFPNAARAVGVCMAKNPVPILVPCHRVVCANGSLGGFSAPGGLRTKERLLRLEGVQLKLRDGRPVVSPKAFFNPHDK